MSLAPIVGAEVELIDQDVPRPAGDDAIPPSEEPTVVVHPTGVSVSESTRFEPPTEDDVIARGSTDADGRLRLVLTPGDLLTYAGTVHTKTVIVDHGGGPGAGGLGGGGVDAIPEATAPLHERKPDLFFRLRLPNGEVRETKFLPGGFSSTSISRIWAPPTRRSHSSSGAKERS